MRIAKLQRGVVFSTQAVSNRGYGELFPPGRPQWTAANLEPPSSSGIDGGQWEDLLDMPLSSPCSGIDPDPSATDEDAACFEDV